MVHFSNIIKDHNEMRKTITQIEAMKKKIKAQQLEQNPPDEFALRNNESAIGQSEGFEGHQIVDDVIQDTGTIIVEILLKTLYRGIESTLLNPRNANDLCERIKSSVAQNTPTLIRAHLNLTRLLKRLSTKASFTTAEIQMIKTSIENLLSELFPDVNQRPNVHNYTQYNIINYNFGGPNNGPNNNGPNNNGPNNNGPNINGPNNGPPAQPLGLGDVPRHPNIPAPPPPPNNGNLIRMNNNGIGDIPYNAPNNGQIPAPPPINNNNGIPMNNGDAPNAPNVDNNVPVAPIPPDVVDFVGEINEQLPPPVKEPMPFEYPGQTPEQQNPEGYVFPPWTSSPFKSEKPKYDNMNPVRLQGEFDREYFPPFDTNVKSDPLKTPLKPTQLQAEFDEEAGAVDNRESDEEAGAPLDRDRPALDMTPIHARIILTSLSTKSSISAEKELVRLLDSNPKINQSDVQGTLNKLKNLMVKKMQTGGNVTDRTKINAWGLLVYLGAIMFQSDVVVDQSLNTPGFLLEKAKTLMDIQTIIDGDKRKTKYIRMDPFFVRMYFFHKEDSKLNAW